MLLCFSLTWFPTPPGTECHSTTLPHAQIREHGQEGPFSSCGFHHCPSALTGYWWGWGENDIGAVCLRGMSATRKVRAGQCSRLLAVEME